MPIHIDVEVCKGCGLCVYYCPRDVLHLSDRINVRGYTIAEVVNYEDCTHCRLCELSCPDLAIYVEKPEKEKETSAAAPDYSAEKRVSRKGIY